MTPPEFEPAIPVSEQPLIHALACAATKNISEKKKYSFSYKFAFL
jgi:hypothetical protein